MVDSKDISRKVGQNLRRFRSQKGLAQIDVAVATDLNRTYVSRIETGKARITFNLLCKLVTGLEIKPADLIDY